MNEVLSATLTEGEAFVQTACSPKTKAALTARCWYRTILLGRKAMYVVNCRLVGKLSAEHVHKLRQEISETPRIGAFVCRSNPIASS